MADIGKISSLKVTRIMEYGAILDGGEIGDVLLPKKQIPLECERGDEVEAFVYMDKEKHLRATTQRPYATVGQFAALQALSSSSSGTWLDWGLATDLFAPSQRQQSRMVEGESYVVFVFLENRTQRILASSKLEPFLDLKKPRYEDGEKVNLLICDQTDLGYKALINDAHMGIIYKNEVFQKLHTGQRIEGYIKKIREDFKIDISLQEPGYQRVDAVSGTILNKIKSLGGRISITDKSPPEAIYVLFGISKKTFKKAIGALYKRRLVVIESTGISIATGRPVVKGRPPMRRNRPPLPKDRRRGMMKNRKNSVRHGKK
jgi:uncharacterized protein